MPAQPEAESRGRAVQRSRSHLKRLCALLRFGKWCGSLGPASVGACHWRGIFELVARGHEIDQFGDRGLGSGRIVDDLTAAEEIDAIANLEHLGIVVGDQD